MAGRQFAIYPFLVTNSGYKIQFGMVGIAADHAVGVGEKVKEAAGWIVLPGKGRLQSFQIHPNNATLLVLVKMGVLHGAGSKHQAVARGTSQGIVLFLERALHQAKGGLLDHMAVGVIGKIPDS